MMLRRLALASTLPLTFAAFLGAACSSSETPAADPFANSGLDSVPITKAEACARYVAALQRKAESIPCSLAPAPACPDILDQFEANAIKSNPGLCIGAYSNGSITNCEARIATYKTCADFSSKPCIIGIIPAAPGSCSSDAGTDSGTDSGGSDSGGGDSTTDTFETSPLDDAPAADAADAGGGG
jgi:hypothetical protein